MYLILAVFYLLCGAPHGFPFADKLVENTLLAGTHTAKRIAVMSMLNKLQGEEIPFVRDVPSESPPRQNQPQKPAADTNNNGLVHGLGQVLQAGSSTGGCRCDCNCNIVANVTCDLQGAMKTIWREGKSIIVTIGGIFAALAIREGRR